MITGVTGVTRNGGIDLPTPARTTVPSPASSGGEAVSPGEGPAKVDGAAAGTTRPAATEQHDAQSDRDADNSSAAAATSRYLAELLSARVLGGSTPAARPTQITPERLSSLISYLETNLAPAPTSGSDQGTGGVDVTG